jgi:GntR family transcriptional regulator, transcriptional repressor for pyruvate dehydrogenase complex
VSSESIPDADGPSPNAASLVAAQIRKQIVLGELSEGTVLPSEAEMIKHFRVSRPTLRQAFRILETEHLITVQRGSRGGTTVLRPSTRLGTRYLSDLLLHRKVTLGDVLSARLMIEPAAVAQLARHRNDESLAVLRRLVEEQRAGDPETASAAAEVFHLRLVEFADNPVLTQYCKLLHHLLRRDRRQAESPSHGDGIMRTHSAADAHAKLVDLVAAGAVHAALDHWRDHLSNVRGQLAQDFGLDTPLRPPD